MRALLVAWVFAAAVAPAAAQSRATGPRERPAEPAAAALERADAALEARQVGEAEAIYASVAERGQSVRALLGLARIQSGRGDPRGALATLERARVLAPNSEQVLSAYARVALAARAPVAAILTLEPLARMLPSVMEYPYLLGVALMQAGDMPNAVFALKDALAIEPNRALTLVALGMALNSQKLYAEAREPLMRSLEVEPDNLEGLSALAESEEGSGALDAAEGHAERVLAREGDNSVANLVLGLVRMKQERYAEARGFLERAVAKDPLLGKGHYQLSLACARLGDDACQREQLELYRSAQRKQADNLAALRGAIGAQRGGMAP